MSSVTVSEIAKHPRSPFVTIRGERSRDIASISIDNDSTATRYPSTTTFEADVLPRIGSQTIEIKATTNSGLVSDTLYIFYTDKNILPEITTLFNDLDEWGVLLNTPRLPGEKNQFYKKRLLHADQKLGGTSYDLLNRALQRSLSLNRIDGVISVSVPESTTTGKPSSTGVFLSVESSRVVVFADMLRIDNERVHVDPGSFRATLSQEVVNHKSVVLYDRSGSKVDSSLISFEEDNKELVLNKIEKQDLLATYKYKAVFPFSDYPTLDTLVSGLNSITTASGVTLLSASTNYPAYKSKNIVRIFSRVIRPGTPLTLDWSEVRIIDVKDKPYRDSLLNEDGSAFNTKLEWIAKQAHQKSNIFLKDTVLNRDRIARAGTPRVFAVLPRLNDPVQQYYLSEDPSDTTKYKAKDFYHLSGQSPGNINYSLVRHGHAYFDYQSGGSKEVNMVGLTEE